MFCWSVPAVNRLFRFAIIFSVMPGRLMGRVTTLTTLRSISQPIGDTNGSWTHISTVKGCCPDLLDDGAEWPPSFIQAALRKEDRQNENTLYTVITAYTLTHLTRGCKVSWTIVNYYWLLSFSKLSFPRLPYAAYIYSCHCNPCSWQHLPTSNI